MPTVKYRIAQTVGRILRIIPRGIRFRIIQAMIAPEFPSRGLQPPAAMDGAPPAAMDGVPPAAMDGVPPAAMDGVPPASPAARASVRWLLEVDQFVERTIHEQCVAWGNGVHVKHQYMTGIHSFFYERIPPGARVLDLGCGIGALAAAIVEHTDAEVIGVDFDQRSIRFAQQRFAHPRLRFIVGDVLKVLPDTPIDVIMLSSVLEHLEQRADFLRRLVARFHPQLFLIRVPTMEQHVFAALRRELGLPSFSDPTHVLEYTPAIFADEMAQAGLAIRHLEVRWGDIWAVCVPDTAGAA